MKDPSLIGEDVFNEKNKLRVKKIVSGSNHTLALSECGKVYGWGDSKFGKIGKVSETRKS